MSIAASSPGVAASGAAPSAASAGVARADYVFLAVPSRGLGEVIEALGAPNITTLADMEALFEGIPLGDITTSMTINSPASMIFAMYLVVAEQQGADWTTLSGTIQNDIMK